MKSEAIRCAIKLYSEPTLLARFNDPYRKLPRGITELLRIVSSDTALKNISLKNKLHAPHLKKVLINYIQLILLQDDNSNKRKLGLDSHFDAPQAKLHYKLLMNIFHPDKSSDYVDPIFSQTILRAYKTLQHNQEKTKSTTTPFKATPFPFQQKHYYSDKSTGIPKAKQKGTLGKTSLLKAGTIAILTMIFSVMLLTPSSPQLVSKKNTESPALKNYEDKSSGWKSPRARNTQQEIIKPNILTQ